MTINNNYLTTIVKKSKAVGRGIGSGRGKTSGRGQKGQGSRKSPHTRPGFEGGQTPVYRRFPKRGFKTPKITCQIINLERLQKDQAIISEQTVDFTQEKIPVKVLAKGDLTKILTIRASAFSQSAQAKITKTGGKFQIIIKK